MDIKKKKFDTEKDYLYEFVDELQFAMGRPLPPSLVTLVIQKFTNKNTINHK